MTFTARIAFFVLIFSAFAAAANNPVPFVNQPLVPASVAPGGNNFQLTVNGTGFVSGSTVNWNGSPRVTTFVNQGQLTATILSTDIATASTASITVTSPAPGGGASSVVFLPVRNPSSFVSLNTSTITFPEEPIVIAAGDFNKDGKQDLAVGTYNPTQQTYGIAIMLGNGDGTFTRGASYPYVADGFMASFDLNNDGNLDLVFDSINAQDYGALGVMFGNGDGTFQPAILTQGGSGYPTFGDFNRDGAIDVAYAGSNDYCIILGNGDGTFQPQTCTTASSGGSFSMASAGDFNGDGKLDLAMVDSQSANVVVVLGNGDGTFGQPKSYADAGEFNYLTTADFNGDGNLDLAVVDADGTLLTTLLGNGDGSFTLGTNSKTPYGAYIPFLADMNGDGILDLVGQSNGYGAATVWLSEGNPDGTFQDSLPYDGGFGGFCALADFNGDGKIDIAIPSDVPTTITLLTQDNGTVLGLSHDNLKFPTQAVGTVSQPKLITVTNNGTAAVKFNGISTTANFSQLSNCKLIQPGTSCEIGVYFTPTTQGTLPGYLAIADNGGGSPQLVTLSGVATIVELDPTSLNFGDWKVGSISNSENVILTNNGNSPLQISKIGIGGADPHDFYQVNACPAKLAAGASCTITVLFHPTATGARSALLGVEDNGGGSPQTVTLSGTGT